MSRELPKNNFHEVMTLIRLAGREGGVSFQELERDHNLTRKRVMEYVEVLPQVEIPPYMPDDILDVRIIGDRIEVDYPLRLDIPMNLGEVDLLALRFSLQWASIHGLIAEEKAGSILEKINPSRGFERPTCAEDGAPVLQEGSSPAKQWLSLLSNAIEESKAIRLIYFSKWRGETSARTVLPFRLFFRSGDWYLRGYQEDPDSTKSGWRSYRLDRIQTCYATEERFNPDSLPEPLDAQRLFVFEEDRLTSTRTLFRRNSARYIQESESRDSIHGESDDSLIFDLEVVGFPYYRSFVLQYGSDAEVLSPPDYREAIREDLVEILEGLDGATDDELRNRVCGT